MKASTIPATLSALVVSMLGVGSASAIPASDVAKRVSGHCPNGTCGDVAVPIVDFTAYTGWDCPSSNVYGQYKFIRSQASDACRPLGDNNVTIHSVSQTFGNLKCQLTVFMTPDCSDGGQQIGAPQPGATPGCSSDAGGIKGYKVQCPWW
ncbi:hypothetical protein V8F20_008108 [Naviculisporaceae sp. PSN 640]